MTIAKLRFSTEESVSKTKQKPIDTKQSIFLYVSLRSLKEHKDAMYTIPDTWMWQYGKSRYRDWDGKFLSFDADKETYMRTNTLPGTVATYAFIIVLRGSSTLLYSGREITIKRNHCLSICPVSLSV